MREVACLICHGTNTVALAKFCPDPYHLHLTHLRKTPVTYVVCRSCGFVFTNPALDDSELATLYGEKLRPGLPTKAYLEANRAFYVERYEWVARALGIPNQENREPLMLEVGCAAGAALDVFRERGWRVRGIEPADTFARFAREQFRLDVQTGFFGPGAFEGETFDLVMMSQVLEHVSDPGALLDQAHRNLRDDGRLFLAVPTLMRPMTPVHPMTLQAIHLWIFSLGTLRLMLAQHGFEIADHSVDAKGLLVTAHKSSARQRADGVRDDPAEVIRYFQAFTDPEGVFATNQTALKQCERRGSCPLVLDVDLTGLHVQTGPDGFLNILDCSCDPHRPLYTEDPRPVSGSWSPEPSLSDEGTVVCMGLGMGYLPEAIRLGLKRDQELLICEADARVYKVAMFHRDLSALLRDERVRLIVRDEAAGFDIVLALIGGSVSAVNQIQVVRCAHSPRWHRAAYDRLAQQIQDWMRVFDILDVAAYHERNGNPGGVIEAYEDGLRLCPGDTRLLQGLAVCCARHGKPDQAELLVRAAVDADPSLAEFAGVLLGGLGLDMAAGDMFRVAVERHHERGDLVRKAAEAYQRAIVRTAEVGVAPTVM